MLNKLLFLTKSMSDIILAFLTFVAISIIMGYIYLKGLTPEIEKINIIIEKFAVNNYKIPFYIAERYLTWYNIRTFFFTLHYILTLFSIITSLITVFYASTDIKKEKLIIFFSLLSITFTIANIFTKAESMSYMSQHAWRSLDSCIMQTITNNELSTNNKDKVLTEKVIEIEQYIESYEH